MLKEIFYSTVAKISPPVSVSPVCRTTCKSRNLVYSNTMNVKRQLVLSETFYCTVVQASPPVSLSQMTSKSQCMVTLYWSYGSMCSTRSSTSLLHSPHDVSACLLSTTSIRMLPNTLIEYRTLQRQHCLSQLSMGKSSWATEVSIKGSCRAVVQWCTIRPQGDPASQTINKKALSRKVPTHRVRTE